MHRKQYLIDNNIRFNDSLTIHEDSYFTLLTQNCTEPTIAGPEAALAGADAHKVLRGSGTRQPRFFWA